MEIHVNRNGQQFGPYSAEEVQSYLAQGTLFPGDFAWHEGLPTWTPLSQIPGLGAPAAPADLQQPTVEAQPVSETQQVEAVPVAEAQPQVSAGGGQGGVSASAAMERLRRLQKGGAKPSRQAPGAMSARGGQDTRAGRAAAVRKTEEPAVTVVVAAPPAWKKHLPMVGIIVGVLALVGVLVWLLWPKGKPPLPKENVDKAITMKVGKKLRDAGFEFNMTSKGEINAIWINAGTTVKPETLGELGQLRNLQKLLLRGCGLDDMAVAKLAPLIHLKQLDLRDNPDISDKSVATLKQLGKLEQLGLDGTRITSRGNTDLQATLPKCTVSWQPIQVKEPDGKKGASAEK